MHSHRRQFIRSSLSSALGIACASRLQAAPLASTHARRVLEKKPCGYWRLGEKAGPVIADASGGGHDGTALGQVTFGQKGMLDREADTTLVFGWEDSLRGDPQPCGLQPADEQRGLQRGGVDAA